MEKTPETTLFISVAAPVPLAKSFDYLPPKDWNNIAPAPGARVLIPFGRRQMIGVVLDIKTSSNYDASKLKRILTIYPEPPAIKPSILELLKWASHYYSHPIGECLAAALPKALRQAGPQPMYEIIKWRRTELPFEGRQNAKKQQALLQAVDESADGVWQDSLKAMGFSATQIKAMYEKGYLSKATQSMQSKAMQIKEASKEVNLNQEQSAALARLSESIGKFAVTLLEGVTGSGKTEVYIALVKRIVESGKQALILVPEINLTPQTFQRFQTQLGLPIAIYHSGMSDKEKFITHSLMASGEARILIGTRSAAFMPCQELGAIVIDEEHDSSYKQFDNFKYSARDLSVKRGQIENCPVILGSATPSSDTLQNALSKKYLWVKLTQRANQAQLPKVRIQDARSQKSNEPLSNSALHAIKKTLDSGNQVIVFQNRRGFAPSLMCFDCGWVCPCPNCDARLTIHTTPLRMHCHHCDYRSLPPTNCLKCQGKKLDAVGSGTERIESILLHYFPHAETVRLDRDNIRSQSDIEKAVNIINDGKPKVIIGTQMLAKGHDFHNVTLVVVVDADALFFSSDFKALERGAQQLLQVAGRTGRGKKAGEVIIQSRQVDNPLFDHIKRHDYLGFLMEELESRELCQLPPFSKMLSVRAEASDEAVAHATLQSLKTQLLNTPEIGQKAMISGPIAAVITRKQNIFRYYLHIFAQTSAQRILAQRVIQSFTDTTKQHKVRLSIDVDPIDFI